MDLIPLSNRTSQSGANARTPRIVRAALGFGRARGGATALEFAMVALPLLMLVFSIIEVGLTFIINVNLANATEAASRSVRVGAIVAPGKALATSSGAQLSLADFKTSLCSQLGLVPSASCTSSIQVDMRTLSSFQSAVAATPFTGKTFDATGFCYYSGAPGSVVELRVYYPWQLLTPVLLANLANATLINTSSGSQTGQFMIVSSTEIFVNEPNSNTTNNGSTC